MPLRILITGTSAAVSQVTKTIIDRSLHNCKSEIVDYKQLSLSAKKADYDFAVINDLMADVYYRLPSALNDVPSVLITNNDRILNLSLIHIFFLLYLAYLPFFISLAE